MARDYKTRGPFICQNIYCGKSFMGYPGGVNHVCSLRCSRRCHPIRQSICSVCRKTFEVKSSQHHGRFCSEVCRRSTKLEKICTVCEKSFKVSPSVVNQKTCSRECHFKQRMRSIEERFWIKVQKTDTCWLWIGAKNQQGYGTILFNGKIRLAHRVSYEITIGYLDRSSLLLHDCDVPACVRPSHLRPGTQLENMRQMHERGRALKGYRGKSIRKKHWQQILEFYNYRYAHCGKIGTSNELEKDHYRPMALGGETTPDNIWPLCRDCNLSKARKFLSGQPNHAGLIIYG